MAEPEVFVEECCGTCLFFRPPKAAADGVDVSSDLSGVYLYGKCRRFPQDVVKRPTDWCGEYEPAEPGEQEG